MNQKEGTSLDQWLLPLRKINILGRLVILAVIMCIIPIVLFGFVYRHSYKRDLENKIGQNTEQILAIVMEQEYDFMSNISNLTKHCSISDPVQDLLNAKNLTTYERNLLLSKVKAQVEQDILVSPIIQSAILLDINGTEQYSRGYDILENVALKELIHQAEQAYPQDWITSLPKHNTEEATIVYVSCINRADFSGERIGYVVLLLDEEKFAQEFYETIYEKDQGSMMLVGANGTIISSYSLEFPTGCNIGESDLMQRIRATEKGKSPSFWITMDQQTYFITYRYDSLIHWYTISLIQKNYMANELHRLDKILWGLSGLCILLGSLGLIIISTSIVRPISRLVHYCQDVADRSGSRKIEDLGRDELGYLTTKVSDMVTTIDEYNEKEIAANIERKNLEIQMLQAQINPHFLFNTLNTIKWISVLSRAPAVSDSLAALSALLKNTIVNKDEYLLLEEELENVRNYALIQSLRYGEQFVMKYDIEPACSSHRVLKFLLQPIVENSIIYGVEGMDRAVTILVQARSTEDGMIITVQDDGAGFDASDIEMRKRNKKQFSGIGMGNVRQRIQLAYGSGADMIVESEKGRGTTVKLVLPENKGVEHV